MAPYWSEFLLVALAHLIAVISPGPDFAMVLRQSVTFGRRTGIWTSVGVGAGILVHVTYSLLGIGLLVRSSVLAFGILKWLGALYLAWIGFRALRTRQAPGAEGGAAAVAATPARSEIPRRRGALVTGFLTNALNPKATLFFVALFSVVINPRTPVAIQTGYGIWMALVTMGWFMLVALFFSQERVRTGFLRFGHWFERAMGVILLALGARLALATVR